VRTRLALVSAATGGALALTGALTAGPASGSVDPQACDHTAISLSASPASPVNGATSVTITAHVTDLDQPPLTPVGTVTFTKDTTTTIASPAVDGAGNASTNTFMSVGFHHLAATFTGGTTNNVTFCAAPATTISYLVNNTTTTTTTTPVPPPVGGGVPVYQTCAAAFRAGVHDIPRGDVRYRLVLDRDRDGVACELNGDDGVRPQPPVTVVRPPSTTTIVQQPAPAPAPNNTIVVVPPAQAPSNTFIAPQAPSSGAVATGDGTLAGTA
jgi:hypothetical protein